MLNGFHGKKLYCVTWPQGGSVKQEARDAVTPKLLLKS